MLHAYIHVFSNKLLGMSPRSESMGYHVSLDSRESVDYQGTAGTSIDRHVAHMDRAGDRVDRYLDTTSPDEREYKHEEGEEGEEGGGS